MTMVIINPGTGPVEGATLDHAYHNMAALLADAGMPGGMFNRDCEAKEEDDGRFAFTTRVEGKDVSILMPGLPLDEVRYTGEPGQNIWNYPRLYVDGSSWVWKFAVSQLKDRALPPSGKSDSDE